MNIMHRLRDEIAALRAIIARPVIVPAVALCLAATPAAADPDRWYVMLGSHHVNTQAGYQPFEESNPGLFALWKGQRFDTIAGIYRNSFGRMSASVAASKTIIDTHHADLSVFAGAALYPGNGENFLIHAGDVVPIVGVNIQIDRTLITILPGDGKSHDAVVALGFEVGF
jgi:hypothetical protein